MSSEDILMTTLFCILSFLLGAFIFILLCKIDTPRVDSMGAELSTRGVEPDVVCALLPPEQYGTYEVNMMLSRDGLRYSQKRGEYPRFDFNHTTASICGSTEMWESIFIQRVEVMQ